MNGRMDGLMLGWILMGAFVESLVGHHKIARMGMRAKTKMCSEQRPDVLNRISHWTSELAC